VIAVAGILLAGGCTLGAYLVGRNAEPSRAQLAAERADGRKAVLADAGLAARRVLDRVRRSAAAVGARRGRAAGEAAGHKAGEAEAARHHSGPTALPPPRLTMDIGSGYGDPLVRPPEIFWSEYAGVRGIGWKTWGGEVAKGSGTLREVTACVPSCVEDPGKRTPVTIEAWEPVYNRQGVRLYSKVTVVPAKGKKETHDVHLTAPGAR
jgi:hypothetical protein